MANSSASDPDHDALPQEAISAFQRRRPLFWLALALSAGIALDWFAQPRLSLVGGGCLSAGLLCLCFLALRRNRQASVQVLAAGMLLATCGGMLLHALRVRIPGPGDISRRTPALPSFVLFRGTIVEAGRGTSDTGRLSWTVEVEALGGGPEGGGFNPASGRVVLGVAREDAGGFAEGDRVELRARLEAPPEVTLPESFDYARHLRAQGILRTGVLFPGGAARLSGPAWARPDLRLRRWSSALAARVNALLPAPSPHGGASPYPRPTGEKGTMEASESGQAALLNALLFGRRERVDLSDREAFAVSGAAHLLAISGLQLQFLAFALFRLAAFLRLPRRRAALAVMLFSCAYCALAGADAPILRSTVMIVAYLAALLLRRENDPLSALGASALLILLLAPGQLFSTGFQLSFLAMFSLAALYPAMERAWIESKAGVASIPPAAAVSPSYFDWDWRAWTRTALFVSLAAWLGAAPAVAWHMGRFAVLGLAVNLVAVPLGSLCMVCGLAMLLISPVSRVAAAALALAAWLLLSLMQWLNQGAAALPFASLDVPPPALPALLTYAALLLWVWVERQGMSLRRLALIVPAGLLVLNAGLFFRDAPAGPSLTVLDLKSGRAALVETPGAGAALIDAGGPGQGSRIAEMLRRRGIQRLALLVVGADEPDAIGGALDLLKRVPAARVILPRDAQASQARRELEAWLTARHIPYGAPDLTARTALQGPGEVRWDFSDDGPAPDAPAAARTALSVRVTLPGTRVLFVNARSAPSLRRLLAHAGSSAGGDARATSRLQAEIVRLTPGPGGEFPAEAAQLLRQSGCHTVIAGEGSAPEEASRGLDLAEFSAARGLRLLWPQRDGSVRVQAEVGESSAQALHAFRDGQWRAVE